MSLMSTVAWASSSSDSSSVVPVRAAWCSAENLTERERDNRAETCRGGKKDKGPEGL